MKVELFDWAKVRVLVKERREYHNLTQTQMALLAGVSRVSMTNFETGVHNLGAEPLIRICHFLDVDPKEFVDWDKII